MSLRTKGVTRTWRIGTGWLMKKNFSPILKKKKDFTRSMLRELKSYSRRVKDQANLFTGN